MTTTLITFLLDRTGSMASIKDATMEAFNGYLDGLREAPSTEFSLVQFDSMGIEKTCVNVPTKYAPRLTNDNYIPRSSTPLIDAAYKTIKAVEKTVTERPWITKVIICIQTDGFENASFEHTWQQLNYLIKEKTEAGWAFNFMGASIDAYIQGAKMGIRVSDTVSYNAQSLEATRAVFTSRGSSHYLYASGAAPSVSIDAMEKMAAGDVYAPELKGQTTTNIQPGPSTPVVPNQPVNTVKVVPKSLVKDFSL